MNGASALGLGARARYLLASTPADRSAKSAWLKELAQDSEIALHIVRMLGADAVALESPFQCVLHGRGCLAQLIRGNNGEIVYRDQQLAGTRREFLTIPELAVALRTGVPTRLRPIQHAVWRLRLLHDTGLIELPPVHVPQVAPGSFAYVHGARDGFELLVRCRWFLDPGEPVSFTRSFVATWCGLSIDHARVAIPELVRQGVIVKVAETASAYSNPTYLYLAGTGLSPLARSAT